MKLSRFGRRCVLAVLLAGATPQLRAAVVESNWNNFSGDGLWNTAINWFPEQIPSNGTPADTTYNVRLTNVAPARLTSNRIISNLALDDGAILDIDNVRTLILANDALIHSDGGRIRFNATANSTGLNLGNTLLTGSLTITSTLNLNNRIQGTSSSDRLTIDGAASLISDAGRLALGNNFMAFTNNGLIDATGGTMIIDTTNNVDSFNTRMIRVRNDARLELAPGTIINTGGEIRAEDSSAIVLAGATINGGKITTAGAAKATMANLQTFTLAGALEMDATFAINAAANLTNILIADGTSFGGRLEFQNSATFNNRILGVASTNRLTLGPAAMVELTMGNLDFGANFMAFTNQGLLKAQGANMTIDPANNATSFNSGSIIASAGGRINFNAGTVDNSGGVIRAQEGSTIAFQGGTITSGRLATEGNGRFIIENLRVGTLGGAIEADARLAFAAGANTTDLLIIDGTSLAGNLTIDATDTTLNRIYGIASTDRLTLEAAGVVSLTAGQVNFGANFMAFTNQGVLTAQGGRLTIDPVSSVNSINTGMIIAQNGGRVDFHPGVVDNTGGSIRAEDNSTVGFFGGTILSGHLAGVGSGRFIIENLRTATFGGNMNLDATLTFAAGINTTDLIIINGTSFTGGLTVNATNTLLNRVYGVASSDKLTIAPASSISFASGQVNFGTNFMTLDNQGVIEARDGGRVFIDPTDNAINPNSGVIKARDGGTVELASGTFDNTGGQVQALDGGAISFNGGRLLNGTLRTVGTGRFQIGNLRLGRLGGMIAVDADMEFLGLANSADLIFGETTLTGRLALRPSATTLNRVYGETSTDRLTIAPGSTLSVVGGQINFGTNFLDYTNHGTFEADGAQRLLIDPSNAAGRNLGVMRAINGGLMELTGGGLENSGQVRADGAGAIVRFGSGATITGSGDLIAESGGDLQFMVGSSVNIDGSMRLISGGRLTLNNQTITLGSLQVDDVTALNVSGTIGLTKFLNFEQTDETLFTWNAGSNLKVVRTAGGFEWVRLEVGGEDLGTNPATHVGDPAGFINNFHLPKLELASGSRAVLVDLVQNQSGGGAPEAIYVDNLVLGARSLLNLRGLNLYYKTLTGSVSQIIDTTILQPGDLNLDGRVDDLDIDLLFTQVNGGSTDLFYDLTADGLVNQLDVDHLVKGLLDTFYGDADLNRSVSIGDLTVMAEFFNLPGHWAQGDFSGNGVVSIGDLTLLAENFGAFHTLIGENLTSVPLPGAAWAGLGLLALVGAGRRRG